MQAGQRRRIPATWHAIATWGLRLRKREGTRVRSVSTAWWLTVGQEGFRIWRRNSDSERISGASVAGHVKCKWDVVTCRAWFSALVTH